jgi:hypothetical protein
MKTFINRKRSTLILLLLLTALLVSRTNSSAADGPPRITLVSYLPPDICQYSGASIAVGATGTPPLHYQWRYDSQEIIGQTNSSILLNNVQPLANPDFTLGPGYLEGSYDVVITNSLGSITNSLPWQLIVTPVPRIVTISISQTNVLITWRGGKPPYLVQKANDPAAPDWQQVTGPSNDTAASLPLDSGAAFYRVLGAGTCVR